MNKSFLNSTIAILLICIIVFMYHFFFYNKFLPATDGWFFVLSQYLNEGLIPYKDFHFCMPPVYIYQTALINNLFGENLLTMRVYGIIERCLMCSFLFLALQKLVNPKHAIISILSAFFMFSIMPYDLLSSPLQTSLLVASIIVYLWSNFIGKIDNKINYLQLFLLGFLSFACLSLKQTTGFFIFISNFVILALCQYKRKSLKDFLLSSSTLLVGFLIGLIILMCYLFKNNIFYLFLQQVFLDAADAKGGIFELINRVITNNFNTTSVLFFLITLILCFYILLIRDATLKQWVRSQPKTTLSYIYSVFLVFLFIIILAFLTVNQSIVRFSFGDIFSQLVAFNSIVFLFFCTMFCYYLKKYFKTNNNENITILTFIILSLAFMFSSSLSWQFDPYAIFIALAFFISMLYRGEIPYSKQKNSIFTVLLIGLSFCLVLVKYQAPYRWWNWGCQNISTSIYKSKSKKLEGFTLDKNTAIFYDYIIELANDNLKNNDYIYAFPNMPIFYYLASNYPEEISPFPHIDVYPDKNALKDAQYIKNNPPKIIIFTTSSPSYWTVHELHFRKNNKSAQRQILKNIYLLISQKDLDYSLLKVFINKTNIDGKNKIYVYGRGVND